MNLGNTFGGPTEEMPRDVKEAFLKILYFSFLEIRINSKKPDLCYAFSDHAHNIPGIISNYSPETFRYYWEIERPCFIQDMQKLENPFKMFNEQWLILEKHYKTLK